MKDMKVFISYAREDQKAAIKLFNKLKTEGVIPWIDYENILAGHNWKATVKQAIKGSSYFLALLSSNSVNKKGYNNFLCYRHYKI
ncbi:MAG: toll/interleukin-1 receptor domain-containing protein [Desulfobacteraceae bacterium]|nr:toll/interleukin-1 receptor domain-containing protein [Desulfobacteraceae bacterium]